MTREIPLANGRGTVLVDEEDYYLVSRYQWHKQKAPHAQTAYAYTTVRVGKKRYGVPMHRLIVGDPFNKLKRPIDHIDNNGLNNVRINLRFSTRVGNALNRSALRNNTSGFRGVYRHKNKWCTASRVNGVLRHLGYFDSPEEASRVYEAFIAKRLEEELQKSA